MSNLIITIIAIALVAVAALAASYYGSSTWNKGQEQARATTLLNQREQIKAAAALYKASHGDVAVDVATLNSANLLSNVPEFEDATWTSSENKVFVTFSSDVAETEVTALCEKAYNSQNSLEGTYSVPSCDSISDTDVCCWSD